MTWANRVLPEYMKTGEAIAGEPAYAGEAPRASGPCARRHHPVQVATTEICPYQIDAQPVTITGRLMNRTVVEFTKKARYSSKKSHDSHERLVSSFIMHANAQLPVLGPGVTLITSHKHTRRRGYG